MGKFRNYRYNDEVEPVKECESCGCMTMTTLCSSCQEEKAVKKYGKALTVFINDEYHRRKLEWPEEKVMSEKEYAKWERKYQAFLVEQEREDCLTIHEIMSFRM